MEHCIIKPDKFKDECGVFGIYGNDLKEAGELTYLGLFALQHRGQENAGISCLNDGKINCVKGKGLLTDVFKEEELKELSGNAAIGHVRYSTTGSSSVINAQPLVSTGKLGDIAIAHNGNLTNADVIRELLEEAGSIFQTTVDTEVVLNLIGKGAKKGLTNSVYNAMQAIKGSYALVLLTKESLIGVRDPNGIRPLCLGKLEDSYILASESCAIDALGGDFIRDIAPGEIVIIDKNGVSSMKFGEKSSCETCSFEYIYFARPDSYIDGISVYNARVLCGEKLYESSPCEADIVVGVPDSGIAAAVGFSRASKIPYGIGFIKNKYVARTFISPTQEMRERAVSVKLNPLKINVEGKRVVLIDDSIVRGTTSRKLVELLRRAGAKEIHMRIASPVVKYPCYFGIDTPYRKDLIGANLSVEEIREEIGCDSLSYLKLPDLLSCLGKGKGFCTGCFNGIYPLSAPVEMDKNIFERKE